MYDQMQALAAVVEHRSVNRAAQALNISQPALSRKISSLEEELGVKLFHRRGKRLELTRVGQISYEYAVEMRQLHGRFLSALSEFKSANRGRLTIAASLTTLQSTLPDLIAAFTKHAPDVDIHAVTGKTHEIVSLVMEKKCDIGLVASLVDTPDTVCVPLFDDHLALVLPSFHPLGGKADLGVADLERLPMILFSQGTWYRVLTDELLAASGVVPDVKMEIDSFEVIVRLVSACNLATLLPQSYLRSSVIDDNAVVVRQIPDIAHVTRTTSLLFAKHGTLTPAAAQLVELAKQTKLWGAT
ncbi:LysR family transcriptional regulator [Paenibacillus sp.]|uniref:LysR family transcriptional regulator n=1 Tax=Paenibacillus sp. TaxID=58172 RepID=UPI002D2337DD|nr:LysR family transcriptional regulator [Paenibacillus sp.]HZG57551.1 LysR family transcriptional regulator [Paenibacillus sp.]